MNQSEPQLSRQRDGEKGAVKLEEETKHTVAKEEELAGGGDVTEDGFGPVLVWASRLYPSLLLGIKG